MNVEKKELEKSQIEITVQVPFTEFQPYLEKGAEEVSKDMKIEGFRPGKVPYDILKTKVGEMTILESAARIMISKTIDKIVQENTDRQVIGQPQISLTKLVPNDAVEYKVVMDTLPIVELGTYKELGIKEKEEKVEEEEIEKVVNQLREAQVKEVAIDRPAKQGDKLTCNIKMFIDKVPVDGGNSNGVAIILGKDYIVPGVDKNLMGAKKDETKNFEIVYPADHFQKNLAGKKVEFEIKVADVFERQLPEVNEDFVKNFGLKNKEELYNNIRESLTKEKEAKAKQKAELEILEKIISSSKISEIPDILIQNETGMMIKEMEHNLIRQGANFDDYLGSINKTREQLAEDFKADGEKRVKSALVVRQIILDEKMTMDEKEVDTEIEKMKEVYKDNKDIIERISTHEYRHGLANQMLHQKAMDDIRKWNIK
ncbi:MAG: trigger factor [bacterium]